MAPRLRRPSSAPDIVSIGEAAALLGVSEMLRRRDKSGKFCPHRQPRNGYRVCQRATIVQLREQIESGASP